MGLGRCFQIIQQNLDLERIECETRPMQDIMIFGQDSCIDAQNHLASRQHPDDFAAWAEGIEQSGDKNVRIENDLHDARLRRARRTWPISASISAAVILSAPRRTDSR